MSFKIPDTPEELFRQGSQQMSKFNKWLPFFAVVFFILFTVLTSFYSVETDEVGIIRRFGKYIRTTQPGLHWKIPLNIETLETVKVRRIFKEEFGFRTLQAGVNTRYSQQNFNDESLMLTGDLNVLDVTWTVQFKVKDPANLLFKIRDPRETVRDLSEVMMRLVIGDSSVSEALTTRRVHINNEVERKLQDRLDEYESGIDIVTVKLQDVDPPSPVQDSFNAVNNAKQEKERVINQAQEARNKVIPQAKGQADKTVKEAEAYAVVRVKRAEGEAVKFIETWNAYKLAKDVTRRRLYLETLNRVIPNAGKVFVFEPGANNVLPLLNLTEGVSK